MKSIPEILELLRSGGTCRFPLSLPALSVKMMHGQLQYVGLLELRQCLLILQRNASYDLVCFYYCALCCTYQVHQLHDEFFQLFQAPVDARPSLALQQRLHYLAILIRSGHGQSLRHLFHSWYLALALSRSNWLSLCSEVDTAHKMLARLGLTKYAPDSQWQRQKQRLQILSVITTTASLQRRQRQQQRRQQWQNLARVLIQKLLMPVKAYKALCVSFWFAAFECFLGGQVPSAAQLALPLPFPVTSRNYCSCFEFEMDSGQKEMNIHMNFFMILIEL